MQGNTKLKSRPGGSGGVWGACLLVGASAPEEMAAETHSFTQHTVPISYRLFDQRRCLEKKILFLSDSLPRSSVSSCTQQAASQGLPCARGQWRRTGQVPELEEPGAFGDPIHTVFMELQRQHSKEGQGLGSGGETGISRRWPGQGDGRRAET